MPLSIKNAEVERLAEEVAETTGERKTEAIRRAPEERRNRHVARMLPARRRARLLRMLEREIRSAVPKQPLDTLRDKNFEDRAPGYEEARP